MFKKAKSFAIFPFRVFYMFVEDGTTPLLAGFGASAKNFKKAVNRNRIKRLTREAYRLQKSELYETLEKHNSQLALFFIYTGKEIPLYTLVKEKMGIILQRLISILNENRSSPA